MLLLANGIATRNTHLHPVVKLGRRHTHIFSKTNKMKSIVIKKKEFFINSPKGQGIFSSIFQNICDWFGDLF